MKATRKLIHVLCVGAAIGLIGTASWQAAHAGILFVPGSVAVENGDVNADGARDLSDAVSILTYLFSGGPAPRPLACEPGADFHNGDVNGSGTLEMSDAIYLLEWLFHSGRSPVTGCPLD